VSREGANVAELTITLSREGPAGRHVIRVGFRADDDAIPHEHEIQHRRLVTKDDLRLLAYLGETHQEIEHLRVKVPEYLGDA
jgi:hypothetical protein